MYDMIIINNKEIKVKEYNGERVVTAWDIAKIHEKDVNEITKNFNRNRETFDLNEDYFVLNREEFFERFKIVQDFIPNNVKEIILFTQSGYLLLAKTFSDKLSWKIQKELLKKYFTQNVIRNITESEYLKDSEEIKFKVHDINDKPTELQKYNFERAELLIKAAEMLPESKLKTKIIAEASRILTDEKIIFIDDEDF